MQDYPVRMLRRMLEVYSPSGCEDELATLLRTEMNSHGLTARIDNAGNVIGETGSQGPRILLCGHMDTVPGNLPVREEEGFLYGRGAVDAKSSLAAMFAGCILARERNHGQFQATVAGVVEEETTSRGIKALIEEGRMYDLAVFGEPSGLSNIVIGYKGSLQVKLTVLTQPAHSASPWLSNSSFDEAVEFWKLICDHILGNGSPSKFSSVTGCVTKFEAGDGTNTIPSSASMNIDIRIPPGVRSADVTKRIQELTKLREQQTSARRSVSFTGQTEAYVEDEDSIGIRAFRSAIRKVTGGDVTLVKKTGTSDMNEFAESSRIPMVAYGPGDSSLDHTNGERVRIEEVLKSVEVYATAIERFSTLARQTPLIAASA